MGIEYFMLIWSATIIFCVFIELIAILCVGVDGYQESLKGEAFKFSILLPLYIIYWIPRLSYLFIKWFSKWIFSGIKDIPTGKVFETK